MRHSVENRPAFTLIELVVVLAITAVALAVVAPSLVIRPLSPAAELQNVINTSRRSAARRAQTLNLDVKVSGEWGLSSATDNASLGSGKLDVPVARGFRVRISPLGLCAPESDSVSVPLDPLNCVWHDTVTTVASPAR